jgi:hypothetical protein
MTDNAHDMHEAGETTHGDFASTRQYVYTLAYPDGRVFYVGKGTGNRIDEHEGEARNGAQSDKCDIIRAIWAQGGEVVKARVAYFPNDAEALQYEHYLISTLPGLANKRAGEARFSTISVSPEDQIMFGASIRRTDEDGVEYWSAREVANFLGYAHWKPFHKVILNVQCNLAKIGLDVTSHFWESEVCVTIGGDAGRTIKDVGMSRTGFLLALNGADKDKAMVAYGKSYLALQAAIIDGAKTLDGANIKSRASASRTAFLAHTPQQKLRYKQLPTPAESIQQLQTRERKQLEGERQPSLFEDAGEH